MLNSLLLESVKKIKENENPYPSGKLMFEYALRMRPTRPQIESTQNLMDHAFRKASDRYRLSYYAILKCLKRVSCIESELVDEYNEAMNSYMDNIERVAEVIRNRVELTPTQVRVSSLPLYR